MLCFAKISRGSDFKGYGTKAGMNKHLQRKHLESWKKLFPTKKVPEKNPVMSSRMLGGRR